MGDISNFCGSFGKGGRNGKGGNDVGHIRHVHFHTGQRPADDGNAVRFKVRNFAVHEMVVVEY